MKPILKLRAKGSVAGGFLRVTLVDGNGRAVDNVNNNFELTTSYQTYTFDFSKHFRNYYGGNPGIVDSVNIRTIQIYVNPGYASYPYTSGSTGITYNARYSGTVDIEWMGIGNNCNPPVIAAPAISSFTPSCLSSGTSVTITGTNLSSAGVTFNGTTAAVISNSSTQIVTIVPAGVTAGAISVTTSGGTATSTTNYSVAVTPSISISVAGGNTICSGTSVTFTATPVNGGSAPAYQWKVNGTNAGTNGNTFTSSAFTNGQQIACVLTSNAVCVTQAATTSNGITMTVSDPATVANAGVDQNISTSTATMSANAPSIGTGSWTKISGTGTISNVSDPTTAINGLSVGTSVFRWTITNGACSDSDDITINVSQNQIGSITGPSTVEPGLEYTYSVSGSGSYTWTVPNGATIVSGQGTNTLVVVFTVGANGSITVSDGSVSVSKDVSVDQTTGISSGASDRFDFYPNPFNHHAIIKVPAYGNEYIRIKILDSQGKDRFNFEGEITEEMILGSELQQGCYTVVITFRNSVKTIKVLKLD
jgi:hypothetical protein